MTAIRKAEKEDLVRIAEILVFNFRMNFYPIFLDDEYYFKETQVPNLMKIYEDQLDSIWVYDDGVVKGFLQMGGTEVKKLYVEPVLQNGAIGAKLLAFALTECGADHLWALEENYKAIAFYKRHGFHVTGDKKPEEGTEKSLIRLEL